MRLREPARAVSDLGAPRVRLFLARACSGRGARGLAEAIRDAANAFASTEVGTLDDIAVLVIGCR